ncbi:ankyrin repeat and SOCS box protein 2-like [Labrus bergylta]|uniref:ankyrin repeat and SOCS box protein 2-like n=1 Tax=Labrus bergylta TaxID=56723 RepID=UPI00331338F3
MAAAASVSRSASGGRSFEDYSIYSTLSDDELLQLAIERSLTDLNDTTTTNDAIDATKTAPVLAASPPHPPDTANANANANNLHQCPHNPPPTVTPVHYSSPYPPSELPPDLKTFKGSVSHFITGTGKRMVAYRSHEGSLVHVCPEPDEEEEPLFEAIRVGDAKKVRELATQSETNLMLPSKPGWLAIHQAAWYGQETCLKVLLSAQPGMINKRTESGETALLVAVSKGRLNCVNMLLEYGADVDIANHEPETPLYKACERSSAAIVAALLNYGAAVNTRCILGWTALQEAVCRNNLEICDMLMKAGAKHNVKNTYGISPLFTAAQSGQLAALRFLLKHGADINSQAPDGATALYEAAKNGHEKVVELLVSQKADANKPGKTGLLPIHIAAQIGSVNIVRMLMGATSKARVWRTGISPLHLAAERNRDDVLEALIEAGYDVNAMLSEERSRLYEDRRSTALYFSVINNNVDAVRMLLAAGANSNLDVFGTLMVAARMGCIETLTLLVEHGADINASILTHPTTFPAVYMFSMKYLSLFKYLLDNGGHALSCFDCFYGNKPHPPIRTTRSQTQEMIYSDRGLPQPQGTRGVQFCEMISAPNISRWAGPIIDVLLDYVGNVTLCSKLMEHLDSYPDWSGIKEKAAPPRPLIQLCRLEIRQLVGRRGLKRLPLPGGLIRFLSHDYGTVDEP